MPIILTLIVLILIPIILKISEKSRLVSVISPIALAYIAGISLSFSSISFHQATIMQVTELSIALSICLFVLASNIDKFSLFIKPLLKSFLLGILSLLIAIFLTYFVWNFSTFKSPEIMGMLVGLYVGGTPNLNAIGIALGVTNETIVIINTADITLGGIYFLVSITILKPILSLILSQFKPANLTINKNISIDNPLSKIQKIKMIFYAVILAILMLSISFGLVNLGFGYTHIPLFLITLTTLSIIGAQQRFIKKIAYKFETAEFLLLIFSFGIGLQIDLNALLTNGLELYFLVGTVFISTILIHILLAWITKTDVDTLMISSTAALFGPAFIPPVAKAINNKELIVYGIALGLLGYILGNYLGLGIAWFLHFIG